MRKERLGSKSVAQIAATALLFEVEFGKGWSWKSVFQNMYPKLEPQLFSIQKKSNWMIQVGGRGERSVSL